VHGSEGGAITGHFLMGKLNKRTDEYGGSLENRARFWLETIELVREAVGEDCAITARLCIDTLNDSPLGIRAGEEAFQFIQLADHLVDFWDLQVGGWSSMDWPEKNVPASRVAGEFNYRSYYEAVRPATNKPIAAVGRFTNPDTMAEAVRSGVIDIIAAARPSIADPFIPKKIEEGRYEDIRECIGCNVCASRFWQALPIICTQNATLGEEFRRGWHPERFARAANAEKTVLVLGAGPAGMECAMVLGKRGMSAVHLVDAEDAIGGSMRAISAYQNLGEWARVITYRQIQLDKLKNVETILKTRLDADAIFEYGAEIVVVATGARWRSDGLNGTTQEPIPGAELDCSYTPEQVSAAKGAIDGEHVLVYDTDGYFAAVGVAELLLNAGKRVTFVTPQANVAPFMAFTGEFGPVNVSLRERGAEIVLQHTLSQIAPGAMRGGSVWGGEASWDADAVVLVTQRESVDGVYRELVADGARLEREGIEAVYRIGDCLAPRLPADSIFEGHRLAREIDSPDPAVALPYLRELPEVDIARSPAAAVTAGD
jgi:dimethylamine/trimethylamine dehydrogenase